jgi:hypothetical protein
LHAPASSPVNDDDEGAVDLITDRDDLKAKPILESVLPKESNKTVRFALVMGVKAFVKNTHFLAGVNGKGCTVICPGSDCIECKKVATTPAGARLPLWRSSMGRTAAVGSRPARPSPP